MKDSKLYLYGASGHAKVIVEIAERTGVSVGGLVDTNPAISSLLGYPVFAKSPDDTESKLCYIIAIGNNQIRKKIAGQFTEYDFATLIHPTSIISKRSNLGEGTVVMAGVSINTLVTVGKHCIINTNSSIDHECTIHDFVHISPNVALAGNVEVCEGAHIGIGASVIQGVKIGRWSTIGAGTVIIQDVPEGATVVGNPGKVIKIAHIP